MLLIVYTLHIPTICLLTDNAEHLFYCFAGGRIFRHFCQWSHFSVKYCVTSIVLYAREFIFLRESPFITPWSLAPARIFSGGSRSTKRGLVRESPRRGSGGERSSLENLQYLGKTIQFLITLMEILPFSKYF